MFIFYTTKTSLSCYIPFIIIIIIINNIIIVIINIVIAIIIIIIYSLSLLLLSLLLLLLLGLVDCFTQALWFHPNDLVWLRVDKYSTIWLESNVLYLVILFPIRSNHH